MAARKKSKKKRSKKVTTQKPAAAKSLRGRKVPAEELKLRAEVYAAQEREGFTNAEAAERAGMGLPAWNQWKQKHRKQSGAGPAKRGRKPGKKAAAAVTTGGTRGRRVDPDEQEKRIAVFDAQLVESFTNAEAAKKAGIGLPAWNQWKQKHAKAVGAGPGKRGRKPGKKPQATPRTRAPQAAAAVVAPVLITGDIDYVVENAQLRGRIAELEAMLQALGQVFARFGVN